MKRIQSKLHRIGTYDVCKISLSCFDDKRYILDDGVNTLAYFHKDIKELCIWIKNSHHLERLFQKIIIILGDYLKHFERSS